MMLFGVSFWFAFPVPPLLGHSKVAAYSKPDLSRILAGIQQLSGGKVSELSESCVVENYRGKSRAEFVFQKGLELTELHLSRKKVGFGNESVRNSVRNIGVIDVDALDRSDSV